ERIAIATRCQPTLHGYAPIHRHGKIPTTAPQDWNWIFQILLQWCRRSRYCRITPDLGTRRVTINLKLQRVSKRVAHAPWIGLASAVDSRTNIQASSHPRDTEQR